VIAIEIPAINTVAAVDAYRSAVADRRSGFAAAYTGGSQFSSRVLRRAADHVDDAVDCVGAPKRSTGPADHLDAFNVLEHHVLRIPEHAREQWTVDSSPIDQHENFVARGVVEATGADRVPGSMSTGNQDVRRQSKRFRQARNPGAANILPRDDEYRCRGVR
jgi:hypothetical protein